MARFSDLTELLNSFTKAGPAGCACGIARDGEVLFEGYHGLADVETGRPIAEDTLYRLFSMTKVIICTAALMLFERGKFLLSDPLYEYFPEYRNMNKVAVGGNGEIRIVPAEKPMLVRHAFMMAVGMPYPFGSSPTATAMQKVRDELAKNGKYTLRTDIRAMAQVPLAFEPGEHWLYGFGHELVAGMIEAASGMKVSEFLKREIFDPLGMKDTAYRFHDGNEARMASMYERAADGRLIKNTKTMLDENFAPDAIYEAGGAGLYSTVRDYLRFTQMMANGGELDGARIIGRKTIDLMRRNHLNDVQLGEFHNTYLDGYGYGLGVRTMMDPAAGCYNGSIGEFGWTGAGGTWTAIDPSEKFSIVYMHQLLPNFELYHHHRVRAVAYGCLK